MALPITTGGAGAPMRTMDVPPAPEGTHEALLHEALGHNALLVFGANRTGPWLARSRRHRAIGVVYRPERDRGNSVPTVMGRRYDAFCSFEATRALHPLASATPRGGEQETYPWTP